MKYTIDAQGKKIGRIASEAASILMGKKTVTFAKNTVADEKVQIVNASKADVNARKKTDKVYVTYTGYRGGLNEETLGEKITRRGMSEVLEEAISRMIPRNKLHKERLKNLSITE